MQKIILRDLTCKTEDQYIFRKTWKINHYSYPDGVYFVYLDLPALCIDIQGTETYLNFNEEEKNFFGFAIEDIPDLTVDLSSKDQLSSIVEKYLKYTVKLKNLKSITLEIKTIG